jgi:NAD(P)H-hydrate repair Nnr-like enzyme with NAD(P)H-hydrate dehydratase domain
MLSDDFGEHFSTLPEHIDRYSAIAIGPGLGWSPGTLNVFMDLLSEASRLRIPTVLDADALRAAIGRVFARKGEAIVAANRKAFDIGLEAGLK